MITTNLPLKCYNKLNQATSNQCKLQISNNTSYAKILYKTYLKSRFEIWEPRNKEPPNVSQETLTHFLHPFHYATASYVYIFFFFEFLFFFLLFSFFVLSDFRLNQSNEYPGKKKKKLWNLNSNLKKLKLQLPLNQKFSDYKLLK